MKKVGYIGFIIATLMTFTACGADTAAGTQDEPGWYSEQNATADPEIGNDSDAATTMDTDTDWDAKTAEELIAMLEPYGDKKPYEKLYEMRSACESIPDVSGSWHRTETHSELTGDIEISDVTNDEFAFTADLYYFSHSGWLEEIAYFVNNKCAIAKYDPPFEMEDDEDDGTEYIAFLWENDICHIMSTASSSELGLGMNVKIDGVYTQEEPVYTNADILNETFTETELNNLQAILPDEYYNDYFLFATTCGIVEASTDDDGNKTVEAFVPTMSGYGYTLVISPDGEIEITFENGVVY